MNTADLIYQNVKNLPEVQMQEVLKFIDFLKFKQQYPNPYDYPQNLKDLINQ